MLFNSLIDSAHEIGMSCDETIVKPLWRSTQEPCYREENRVMPL